MLCDQTLAHLKDYTLIVHFAFTKTVEHKWLDLKFSIFSFFSLLLSLILSTMRQQRVAPSRKIVSCHLTTLHHPHDPNSDPPGLEGSPCKAHTACFPFMNLVSASYSYWCMTLFGFGHRVDQWQLHYRFAQSQLMSRSRENVKSWCARWIIIILKDGGAFSFRFFKHTQVRHNKSSSSLKSLPSNFRVSKTALHWHHCQSDAQEGSVKWSEDSLVFNLLQTMFLGRSIFDIDN